MHHIFTLFTYIGVVWGVILGIYDRHGVSGNESNVISFVAQRRASCRVAAALRLSHKAKALPSGERH